MSPSRYALVAAGAVAALVALAFLPRPAFADGPVLAIDADPSGNGATHIQTINSCVSVPRGDSFQVDVVIENIKDLLAWEVYLHYDPAIVHVTGENTKLFQAANAGSSVFDLSDRVPDSSGHYHIAAADTADPPSPDSGSGVLARITLQAVGRGVSALTIDPIETSGKPDEGPLFRDVDTNLIAANKDTGYFSNEIRNAKVAVGTACPPGSDSGTPFGVGSGHGIFALYLIGPLVAGIAVVLGLVVLLFRRSHGRQAV